MCCILGIDSGSKYSPPRVWEVRVRGLSKLLGDTLGAYNKEAIPLESLLFRGCYSRALGFGSTGFGVRS